MGSIIILVKTISDVHYTNRIQITVDSRYEDENEKLSIDTEMMLLHFTESKSNRSNVNH